ncbi:hypothetical protein ACIA49_11055 [Kribbella sp. NPDC051587]|jgi:hypothetical protein|uniref:hypothetical protein n=1 Tax=Kribbella sp. NPDC051587 TaxID=3364119 RepID=UPI0037944B05
MRRILAAAMAVGGVAAALTTVTATTAQAAPSCPDSYVDGHGTVWVAKCNSLDPGDHYYSAVTDCSNGERRQGPWVTVGNYSSAYCPSGSVVNTRLIATSP